MYNTLRHCSNNICDLVMCFISHNFLFVCACLFFSTSRNACPGRDIARGRNGMMRCMFACPRFRSTTFQQPCKDMLHEGGNATEKKVGEWALIALFLDKHDHGTNVSWWDSGRIKKKHVNVMMSKAMTRCSMDMLQYRCACAMYMCEDMQMHSILKDHNHAFSFISSAFFFWPRATQPRCSRDMLQYRCASDMYMCEDMQMHRVRKDHNNAFSFIASFFPNPEQRNHGHLHNDGRSCAVRQAPHSPFVSTTMQVQEEGDAKEEHKWTLPIVSSKRWTLLMRM